MVPIGKRVVLRALAVLCVAILCDRPVFATDINRTTLQGEAIEGYDVVAFWSGGKPQAGNHAYAYEWDGAVWLFSSAQHLAAFKADPERYAPAFGGYCAYAMTRGVKADIHPFIYEIKEGRLYLFYSFESRDRFDADQALEQAAEDQWAVLSQRYF